MKTVLVSAFLVVIPSVVFASSFSEDLSRGLVDLKTTVERLSAGNDLLAVKNLQIRNSINTKQTELIKIQQSNQQLNSTFMKLKDLNASRSRQIDQLRASVSRLDDDLKGCVDQMRIIQERIDQQLEQEKQIENQIQRLKDPAYDDTLKEGSLQQSQEWLKNQKERMALLKLILESQNRQELLNAQIQDFQKDIPGQEAAQRARNDRKRVLEKKMEELKDEIANLNGNSSSSSGAWTPEQVQQLQTNIDRLEGNKEQLQGLVSEMKQKIQRVGLSSQQRSEQLKLQSNIDQLKNETKGLKFDLEDLQRQMVSLDKRKAYLESLLQK